METPEEEKKYVIDTESAAEMARLVNQSRILTDGMGGFFPGQFDTSNIHDVLDIACGPGGWANDVAQSFPHMRVTGVDISVLMTDYARTQATFHKLNNARFSVMNILQSLDFPDNSFDLVNARFLFAFMPPAAWPKLAQECYRILRPGGAFCLTESEWSISNCLAAETLIGLFTKALKMAGQSFSPDGRQVGITPMLTRFLRDAGFAHVKKMPHAIDYSAGTEAFASTYQNHMVVFKLLQPFMVKMGVATAEEIEVFYQRSLTEMVQDDFCAIWFYLTAWGSKTI
jgi:ubiquinone/menaquinone biosynthesis C-methylase UbiE